MARRRVNTTKYEIIQTATTLFLEKGYSHTTPKLISDALDISTGNLTYYFPTKEQLLCVLVEMLCDFQRQTVQDIIRKNDTQRAMHIYREFCPDWSEQEYIEAEILVSGIEYATVMTTDYSVPIEQRITGALDNIMKIFNVPENIRQQKIDKVLSLDYRALGREILDRFKQFVNETNEQTFEALLGSADK